MMSSAVNLCFILVVCQKFWESSARSITLDDEKYLDQCNVSKKIAEVDPNTNFTCGSGHQIIVRDLCDGGSDCINMDDELHCVDCAIQYDKPGIYIEDLLMCSQTSIGCKCMPMQCKQINGSPIYMSKASIEDTNKDKELTAVPRVPGNCCETETYIACGALALGLCCIAFSAAKKCKSLALARNEPCVDNRDPVTSVLQPMVRRPAPVRESLLPV